MYSYLSKLFKSKIELQEAIKLINIIILKRARGALVYARLTLIISNIKIALKYIKALAKNEKPKFEKL